MGQKSVLLSTACTQREVRPLSRSLTFDSAARCPHQAPFLTGAPHEHRPANFTVTPC